MHRIDRKQQNLSGMKTRNLLSKEFAVLCPKAKHMLGLLLLLSYPGYGQIFKNIGVTSGVNFTPLKWEYQYAGSDPIEKRTSKKEPVAFNTYLTAELLEKKRWAMNSSLGWILKRECSRRTEVRRFQVLTTCTTFRGSTQ